MNKLNEIFSTTFTDALGWTLFHSLWQGAVIAVVLFLLLSVTRQSQAKIRYFMTVSAQISILVVAVATFIHQLNHAGRVTVSETIPLDFLKPVPTAATGDLSPDRPSGFMPDRLVAVIQAQMPLFLLAWFTGLLLAACKLVGGYYYMSTKVKKALIHCPDELRQLLTRLTGQLNLQKLVRVCEVPFLKTPAVFGHLKPVILIPVGLVNHLTPNQVEMVLLHELAHIKRHDFLVNLLQSVIEVIFFFNPAVWWISREIRQERENCCDDLIVQLKGQPVQYIKTLAAVNHFKASGLTLLPGFFGNGKGQLLKRMQRLVGAKAGINAPHGYKVISLLLVLVSFLYFGWVNKHLSTSTGANEDAYTQGILQPEVSESPRKPGISVLPARADTVKKDVVEAQEAKIKKQEALIKELKAKIDALESKRMEEKTHQTEKRVQEITKRSKEKTEELLKLKEKTVKQLDNFENIEVARLEQMSELLAAKINRNLKHAGNLDSLSDIVDGLEFQKEMMAINEEVIEAVDEIYLSGLEEIKRSSEWIEEITQLHDLTLEGFDIDIDVDEIIEDVEKDLRVFTNRIDRFTKRLFAAMQADGIIDEGTRTIKIAVKDGLLVVNRNEVSKELSQKYLDMLEDEFGDISNHTSSDNDFSFRFELK